MKHLFTIPACLLLGALLAFGADKKPVAFTDPKSAGEDYEIQGEYAANGLGAQIIALGDGKFRAVFFTGGLPGAGWDKSPKVELEARQANGTIRFVSEQDPKGTAELTDGVIEGNMEDGRKFRLRKTTRQSPTLGLKPPAGAKVLFDGSDAKAWDGKVTEEGFLKAGTRTKESFTNFTLHVEFRLPFMPTARGQGRGNSGVYLQDRYEVQVLDSFGLRGENNECGGIYTVARPILNMCFPPLAWQTYDIDFTTARFDESGKKVADAVATVRLNGVVVQDHQAIPRSTGGGKPESNSGGPIQLQDHGDPVVYRNIWIVPK